MSATQTETQLSTEAQEMFGALLITADGTPIADEVQLSDIGAVSSSLENITQYLSDAISQDEALTATYRNVATSVMELREQCVLPNAHPDWAGRSKTYLALIGSVMNPLYDSIPQNVREAKKQRLQRGIDNQLGQSKVREGFIAEYCKKGLSADDAKPTQEGKPKAALKKAMKAEYDAQGTNKKGPILTLPEFYGGPVKESGRSGAGSFEPGSPEAIGEKLIQALGSATKVAEDGTPKVSYDFMANALLSSVSKSVRVVVENRDADVPNREALADKYHRLSQLAELANAALAGEWDDTHEATLDAVAYDSNEDR